MPDPSPPGLSECRLVGSASISELTDVWPILSLRLGPSDSALWYLRATDLRVLGTREALVGFSVGELKSDGRVRWHLTWRDITAVKSGRDFFDDYMKVFSGTRGVEQRFNLGARTPDTDLVRRLIEEAAGIHERPPRHTGGGRTVIYIHGIGGKEPTAHWLRPLTDGLAATGFQPPDANVDSLVEVEYQDLLAGGPRGLGPHEVTWRRPSDAEYARDQASFRAERQRLQRAVSPLEGSPKGVVVGSPSLAAAIAGMSAGGYVNEAGLRRSIRQRVLDAWPDSEHSVVIGYSLGSVIAADAMLYLPTGRTASLVTVASPLALSAFQADLGPLKNPFPFGRIRHWINCFDPRDEVTVGRGIVESFPEALDIHVDSLAQHDLAGYLRSRAVCTAVGMLLDTAGERP